MRASITKNGLTIRVISGTHNAIIGIDLQADKCKGCLGFSIQRTDLTSSNQAGGSSTPSRWLPNMLQFPTDVPLPDGTLASTLTAPLQKFRWGDYTLMPGRTYRYRVVARYGHPGALTNQDGTLLSDQDGISVEVTTEDPNHQETAVFFNRAAAASEAFNRKFPTVRDVSDNSSEAQQARKWLSNGLEEALLAFLAQATDASYSLHAAIYEFQKPDLLEALKTAANNGATVKAVYHARQKGSAEAAKDKTKTENEAAIADCGLEGTPNLTLTPRKADPQGAIMHNKFVVLLQKDETGQEKPRAVWTGSTNWTDGGLYGQLNVGHAVYDAAVATLYEAYFELLAGDPAPHDLKQALTTLTPVSLLIPNGQPIIPVFSPQPNDAMLHLYASICDNARCLLVSAPFALSPIVLTALSKKRTDVLRLLLLDKVSSLGKGAEVTVIQGDPANAVAVATTLSSPLHNFQKQILAGREGFHHAGIHIHTKIILADPFGSNPTLVTGSANFSNNSTEVNDSNSLVIRGHMGIVDIYASDFMRMFEQYHFRASKEAAGDKPLGLAVDASWSDKYYVPDSLAEQDRRMFAGTL